MVWFQNRYVYPLFLVVLLGVNGFIIYLNETSYINSIEKVAQERVESKAAKVADAYVGEITKIKKNIFTWTGYPELKGVDNIENSEQIGSLLNGLVSGASVLIHLEAIDADFNYIASTITSAFSTPFNLMNEDQHSVLLNNQHLPNYIIDLGFVNHPDLNRTIRVYVSPIRSNEDESVVIGYLVAYIDWGHLVIQANLKARNIPYIILDQTLALVGSDNLISYKLNQINTYEGIENVNSLSVGYNPGEHIVSFLKHINLSEQMTNARIITLLEKEEFLGPIESLKKNTILVYGWYLSWSLFAAILVAKISRSKNSLEAEFEKACAVNKDLETFLMEASTHTRNSSRSVSELTSLVLSDQMAPEHKVYFNLVNKVLSDLSDASELIRDFTLIEGGKYELHQENFEMNSLMQNVSDKLTPFANSKKQALAFMVAPQVSSTLFGDQAPIQRIIVGLVKNIIRFTSELSSITVFFDTEEVQNTGEVIFKVSINYTVAGQVRNEPIREIESFAEMNHSWTRKKLINTLELSYATKLVKMLRGNIYFGSRSSIGITLQFTVRLGQGSRTSSGAMVVQTGV